MVDAQRLGDKSRRRECLSSAPMAPEVVGASEETHIINQSMLVLCNLKEKIERKFTRLVYETRCNSLVEMDNEVFDDKDFGKQRLLCVQLYLKVG